MRGVCYRVNCTIVTLYCAICKLAVRDGAICKIAVFFCAYSAYSFFLNKTYILLIYIRIYILLCRLEDRNFFLCNLQVRSLLSCRLQDSNSLSCNLQDRSTLSCNLQNSNFLLSSLQDRYFLFAICKIETSYRKTCMYVVC